MNPETQTLSPKCPIVKTKKKKILPVSSTKCDVPRDPFPPMLGLRPNWRQYSGFKLHPTASTLNTRLHGSNSTRALPSMRSRNPMHTGIIQWESNRAACHAAGETKGVWPPRPQTDLGRTRHHKEITRSSEVPKYPTAVGTLDTHAHRCPFDSYVT